MSRHVDIHCHCLPAMDDGPQDGAEAIALCRMLVADGFTDVIATPHQLGRYEGANRCDAIRSAAAQLNEQLRRAGVPLNVHAGAEVRVHEQIPRLLERDEILTLADLRRHLLLELSFSAYIQPKGLLEYLSGTKLCIILAHAERYAALQRDPRSVEAWLAGGAAVQLNADSIVGAAGPAAAETAWQWLAQGWVALVATDAHGAGRRPRMAEALTLISEKLGRDVAYRLCVENPLCVLEGRELVPLNRAGHAFS